MKLTRLLLPIVALVGPPARAAEQIVTLGDSLTFAYEAEFGFEYTVPIVGPTYGDGFGPEVRNWIEILNDPSIRNQHFDIGARDNFTIPGFLFFPEERFLFRHEYNWAVPGQTVDQMRRFVTGTSSFLEIISENPEFEDFGDAIGLTDFDETTQFSLLDFEQQIRDSAERLTFFIGGNDVRGIYGTVYNGGSAGTFVDDFIDDSIAVLDRVETLNPDIQVVIVNVPHIGITPEIKGKYPTSDEEKTGRVTAVLDELNGRLEQLATDRGFGFADIYTSTLPLLGPEPLVIDGIAFENVGTTTGDQSKVWLNGPLSANFHPNTNAHAIVANTIIEAFNHTYNTGITPLSTTEILGEILGKSATEIDMPFATWVQAYGLTAAGQDDDTDGDGLTAGIEFGLGLDPTVRDATALETRMVDLVDGGRAIELSYPVRLPESTEVTVLPASGPLDALNRWQTPPPIDDDGRSRALLPLVPGQSEFIRVEAAIAP